MSGAAWNSVVSAAAAGGTGDVANQDSNHDQTTLAAALVAARTGNSADRTRALNHLTSAIGTESGARWLAIGRNLGSYIIAADLLDVRSGPIYDWLKSFATKKLQDNNNSSVMEGIRASAWSSGSNASAQMGFVATALAVYTGDDDLLAWSWTGFRKYAGDRSVDWHLVSNSDAWQAIPSDPVGIQNLGATKNGCRLDGAISNDMSRGGDNICTPGYTSYPWVGLEGAIPAAEVFDNADFPAYTVSNSALRRAADYLFFLRTKTGNADWYDGTRSAELKHLINRRYGLTYPVTYPVGPGRTVGFTDWTHP